MFAILNPGIMNADGALSMALKASSIKGGITITKVTAQTGAAGTLDLVLMKYGTSGTVAGGTVAHMASGTANVWVANAPTDIPITAAQAYVDSGVVLMLKKLEAGGSDDLTTSATVCIEYEEGVITVG